MKVECTVDGKMLSLSVSSDKPLSLILIENLNNPSLESRCSGHQCGNCIVLMDGKAVLSCLVPAFAVRGATITTFEAFSRSRDYRDIEKAFTAAGTIPCPKCMASRVMLIENILRRYENNEMAIDEGEILQENAVIKCTCMDENTLLTIVREALAFRRKRNVRRA